MVLHTVLALNPGSNMGSPCQGSTKSTNNVVPLDPSSSGDGTGLLLQESRLVARGGTDTEKDQGENTEHAGRHLGHDGSKDLAGWVFTLPVSVFGHVQDQRSLILGGEGSGGTGLHRDRGKGRTGGDNQGADNETKLGHFEIYF